MSWTTQLRSIASDRERRAKWLCWIVAGGTAVGLFATLDPATIRPNWTAAFLSVLGCSGLIAAVSWRWGARWSDRTVMAVLVAIDLLVLLSVVASQDRVGAMLNLVLLVPVSLFAAVSLRGPYPRGQEAVVVVACGAATAMIAPTVLFWATTTALPAVALIACTETALAQRRHLDQTLNALEQQSITDPLTGLLNRRGMSTRLFGPTGLPTRHVTVLVIDIDHFKTINDQHGHITGDEVLRAVGKGLLRETRGDDVAVRIGGEEFVVVTPAGPEDAALLAERLRESAMDWMAAWSGTVSVGGVTAELVSAEHLTPDRLSGLIEDADRCLYQAKRAGRNRVVMDHPAAG
jgi:diguanylate cyclase (GGDEF)-like protein